MQQKLFADHMDRAIFEDINLTDGQLRLYPSFIASDESSSALTQIIESTPWRQDDIVIAGQRLPIPRLQCWMGEPEAVYAYSGIELAPVNWSSPVSELRNRLLACTELSFNSVLINYYRDGRDSVAWHADDEPELGPRPIIASISLGAERPFVLRHKRSGERHKLILPHGSLLLMLENTQQHWQHQLPKVSRLDQARINLTFRQLQTIHG